MWLIWALDLNFKAPNQSCMPLVVKKKGNMWETFPTEGGDHLFPTQLFSLGPELWFFGEDQKCSWGSKMKNKPNFFLITGVSQTVGGGGRPIGNFFLIIPFLFWPRPLQFPQVRPASWVTASWATASQARTQTWTNLRPHWFTQQFKTTKYIAVAQLEVAQLAGTASQARKLGQRVKNGIFRWVFIIFS